MSNQKTESDTLLVPVSAMYSPEEMAECVSSSYLQPQTPCTIPFANDNPMYNLHPPAQTIASFAPINGTSTIAPTTHDQSWPVVEPDKCISSFPSDFSKDPWVEDHMNLIHNNDTTIVEIECDNKVNKGSFPFTAVPDKLPGLDLSEADSNQSTVSSVAELLLHTVD